MRIAKLSLLAFGPFTQGELGFSPKQGVLDVVYGPNEAGKSTSLRALTALLYGIPTRTQDAHLHDMPRLRVGATLLDHAGRSYSFVRRKGQKQTLLDGDDQPVSEEQLSSLLGGLDANMFRHMFGLDHERLRAGAEALLSGGGHVGESLFDAGTGARAIRTVLDQLKLEADELFKSRGPTTKLQVAVRTLREQQKARKEAMLSPQAFTDQRKALAEARAELELHLTERKALLREKSRLERALSVLPLLSRRDRLAEERAALGTPPGFVADEAEQRSELEARLSAEERECARLRTDLAERTAALATLSRPELSVLDHELVRELEQRFGGYRKAMVERPQKRGELLAVQADIALLRERLGGALGALHVLDTPARARLRKRAEEHRALAQKEQELCDGLAKLEVELTERRRRLTELGEPPDLALLESLIERVERDERVQSLVRKESELGEHLAACEQGVLQLGLSLTPSALSGLSLPSELELEHLERALASHEGGLERTGRALAELAERERGLSGERTLLLAAGEVLGESHLSEAREARAQAYARVLAAAQQGAPLEALLAELAERERRADEVVDRLRREASRVHTLLRIELDERALVEARLKLLSEQATHQAALDHARERARVLLAPLHLPVESIHAARPRLKKLELVRERAVAACALQSALVPVRAHLGELQRSLESALGRREPCASLTEALAEARAVLRKRARLELAHEEALARVREAEAQAREHEAQLTRVRTRAASFVASLEQELAGLGFAPGLGVDEALAAADELAALKGKEREATLLAQALERLDSECTAFADELVRLCTRHMPAAAERPVPEAMAMLAEANRQRHEALREHARTTERVAELTRELKAKERELEELSAERARRFARAGVDSFVALREVEQRAKRAQDLDAALEQLDAQLVELSEGLSAEALRHEVRAVDPDEARARLVELDQALEVLGEQVDARNQAIGGLAAGLEQLHRESGAVSLAEETESQLATVRSLARRYAEVRLGHALLSREVERYRAEHQGPVLSRAAQLFPRLTLERYRGLEVALDEHDQPTLVCVRADGKNVRVAGLSDGTRDQLYLALRVASIERYLDTNPPMPLLLDDAFVHFDDARSQAALSVLGELCARTQVIFFTHHARMLELAKKAHGKDKVLVHELDPTHGVVRTRDNGPLFARV